MKCFHANQTFQGTNGYKVRIVCKGCRKELFSCFPKEVDQGFLRKAIEKFQDNEEEETASVFPALQHRGRGPRGADDPGDDGGPGDEGAEVVRGPDRLQDSGVRHQVQDGGLEALHMSLGLVCCRRRRN